VSTETKTALVPTTEGDARRDALLRALGFDRLNEGQRELALAISQQYDLDPMLRHVVMVDGKPYITRDGLLHVAHKSNDFDGIEVDPPALDPDGKYWRTTCRVYRKSFSRPFVYPGRYPATGGNQKYNEEMAIKVAEVMTLRRAFDVSAPVIEERWDGDIEDVPDSPAPTSLAERVAQRALAASASATQPATDANVEQASIVAEPSAPLPLAVVETPEEEGVTEAEYVEAILDDALTEAAEAEAEDEPDVESEPEAPPVVSPLRQQPEGIFIAPAAGFAANPVESLEPQQAPTDDSDPLDHFKAWARDHDKDLIRAVARELFPTLTGFSQLNAQELGIIQHEVTKAEMREQDAATAERCGSKSPVSDSLCTLDPGHKGVHRHGTRESWERRLE
jgi:hypothetical protein